MRYKTISTLILFLFSSIALSAPYIVSDSTDQIVTHCGILLDSAPKTDIPVAIDGAGKPYCKYDLTAVTVGIHTVKATFVKIDPVWGRSESVNSAPFTFTKPASTIPVSPQNLILAP